MKSERCAVCGADENVWLDLQEDGSWRCRDRQACETRRRQGRLFLVRSEPPRDDELLRRCAAGAAAVDRAVNRFRTPHEAPRFDPPTGIAA